MKMPVILSLCALLLVNSACASPPVRPQEGVSALADDGSWCWFGDPRAVSFTGKRSRTYVGTLTSTGDITIMALDNKTGELESVVLAKGFEKDDHANPSVMVREDGRIMVFYSKHAGRAIFLAVSKNPEDISSFEKPQRLDLNPHVHRQARYCYPNPIQTEGKLFMFWRGENWKPTVSQSEDGGKTWTKGRIAFSADGAGGGNRPYTKYAVATSGGIHMAVTDGHPRNEPTNSIYYAKLKDGVFHSADGRVIADLEVAPLRPKDADRVHDGSGEQGRAWIWDVTEDSSGHPVLVYAVLPTEKDHRMHYARWNGKEWDTHEITRVGGWFPQTKSGKRESEPHYSGGAILDHEDPGIVYISRRVNGVFELERWQTADFGATWKSTALTAASKHDHIRPFVPRGHVANGGPSVLWVQNNGHYIHYTNYRSRLMMSSTVQVATPQDEAPRPASKNVLFIAVDDLRPELGCYGADHMSTPCLDRFASTARLFQRHYAVVPTCGASRFALMTGAHPRSRAARDNGAFALLRKGSPATRPLTMPAYFRQNGYHTVSMGKISHSPDGMVGGKAGQRDRSISPVPEMPDAWDVISGPIGRWGDSWSAFFAYPDGSTRTPGKSPPLASASPANSTLPDELTADQAIRFLNSAPSDKPFFLAVGFFKPHLPFVAPSVDFAKYARKKLPVPALQSAPANAAKTPSVHSSGEMFSNYKHPSGARKDKAWHRKLRQGYYAATSYVDSQIGRVLRALEEAGLAESTIVCVWGDHGWQLGSHGVWGKHSLFEEALRSTLIIRDPGMGHPGKSTTALIESADLFPTLAQLAIGKVPSVPDGKDLSRCVAQRTHHGRSHAWAYWRSGTSIRTENYRFTRWPRKGRDDLIELYDHTKDPNETRNIAGRSPAAVAAFQALLN